MSQQMLVAGVAIVTLATAFAGAVRFLVKHYLSELKADGNGGHNLRGRVDRIELIDCYWSETADGLPVVNL